MKSPYLDKPVEQFNQLTHGVLDNVLKIKKKPKEMCPHPTFFIHKSTGKRIAVRCGSWDCPVCLKWKAWKLKKRIDKAIVGKDVRHLTLTIPDNTYPITEMFNNLRTQLGKRGKCKAYFWVKEFQERGVRHLHVIFFEYIHYTEIKTYWEGNIKIKRVRGSAGYLTKYLAKMEAQELFMKGERRYSSSRGFFEQLIKKESTGEWECIGHWDYVNYPSLFDKYEEEEEEKRKEEEMIAKYGVQTNLS